MIRCSELLEEYSDYRDGLLGDERSEAIEEHLQGCSSCSRYDRVLSGGVAELRRIPALTASDDFLARLQHRIYHVEDDMERGWRPESRGVSTSFAVTLCLIIALAAWLPVLATRPATVTLAPVTAQLAPQTKPVPSLFHAGPLLVDDVTGPTTVRTIGLASSATQTPFRVTFRNPGSIGP